MAAAKPASTPAPTKLETRTYNFSVEGTRPILELQISGGMKDGGKVSSTEKLTIEIHSPLSGEVFEAKTQNGRIEVDRDGRVMYFSRGAGPVGFTLFLGRALIVTMSKEGSDVLIETPSKILSVDRKAKGGKSRGPGTRAASDSLRLELE